MLALVLRQKVMCIFVLLEANCYGNKPNCAVERKRPHRKGGQFLREAKKTKICLVKAMFFPVVMYECENWTIKKAEH